MANKRGRPSKLTPERCEKLLNALRAGSYRETACNHAGITYQTFRNWEKAGEVAESGQYLEFYESIKKAEADGEMRDLSLIAKAAESNWQAAAWKLERKYPSKWGRKDATKLEVSGDITTRTMISDEELEQLRRIVDAAVGPDKLKKEKVIERLASGYKKRED